MPKLGLSEKCRYLRPFNNQPLRQAVRGAGQQEFRVRARPAKVFDIGASQTISAHESIDGLSRPTTFDREGPDSAPQRQLTPDHSRGSPAKAMRLLSFDLYARSSAIGFAGERSKGGSQPVDGSAAQQIILRAQIEIPGDVRAASLARALLRFSQRYFPCLLKFTHLCWYQTSFGLEAGYCPLCRAVADSKQRGIMLFLLPADRCYHARPNCLSCDLMWDSHSAATTTVQ